MNSLGFPDYVIQNGDASAVIPFNIGTADAQGTYWYLDGPLNGWDSPDTRETMLPKQGNDPGSDGEYAADLHYRGRTISCKLRGASPSETAREASMYLLAQTLDLIGGNTGLFLANEVVPKQLVIQRAGNTGQGKLTMRETGFAGPGTPITPGGGLGLPTPDANGLIYLCEADIEMYAADPRKYSQTVHRGTVASSTVSLTNAGNTSTQNMRITINAGIANQQITIDLTMVGVDTMVFTWPTLPSSAPPAPNFPAILNIDCYNKRITDGSSGNRYYLRDLRYPWLQLPPGTFSLNFTGGFVGSPDGSFVDYRDAWI